MLAISCVTSPGRGNKCWNYRTSEGQAWKRRFGIHGQCKCETNFVFLCFSEIAVLQLLGTVVNEKCYNAISVCLSVRTCCECLYCFLPVWLVVSTLCRVRKSVVALQGSLEHDFYGPHEGLLAQW